MTTQPRQRNTVAASFAKTNAQLLRHLFPMLALLVTAVNSIAMLPHDYNFVIFGFCDSGACLTVDEVAEQGKFPYVDYPYEYGFLPVLVGRGWFALMGRSPAAFLIACGICNLARISSLVRFADAIELSIVGRLFLLVSLPRIIPSSYITITHALEALLLSEALTQLVQDRRGNALVLATICLFVKPSTAYFLGLFLVLFGLRAIYQRSKDLKDGLVALYKQWRAAAAVGVSLLALFSFVIGPTAATESLLPLTGLAVNSDLGLIGFAGARSVFLPEVGNMFGYYFGTSAFFLAFGSVLLTAGAFVAAVRLFVLTPTNGADSVRNECVVTCAVLNILYFALMWDYVDKYDFLLCFGLTAMPLGFALWRVALWLLVVVTPIGYYSTVRTVLREWAVSVRTPSVGGLFCPADMAEEWSEVRRVTDGRSPVLLAERSGYSELFPGFGGPRFVYFLRASVRRDEVRSRVDALANAEYVVRMCYDTKVIPNFPEVQQAMQPFEVYRQGRYFVIYRRLKS